MPGWQVDSETIIATTRSGKSVWEWPTIVACGMLLGFAAAHKFRQLRRRSGRCQTNSTGCLRGATRRSPRLDRPDRHRGRRDQLTAVATLSPRGFYPLLARNKREVMSQIREHTGTLGLAVVDGTLPDYASIARVLSGALPTGSVIVLKGSHRSEDIGPMLLERLGVLESKGLPSEGEPNAKRSLTRSAALRAD